MRAVLFVFSNFFRFDSGTCFRLTKYLIYFVITESVLLRPPEPVKLKSTVELDSLVSNVRDLLPHLGEGFVELCLQHYDYKVDEVINAMLEGNLAPHLAQLDQGLPRVAREPQAVAQPELALPGRSVYDDDDFDINTRDTVDLSRVHRGKKNKGGDALKLLDDKRDLGKNVQSCAYRTIYSGVVQKVLDPVLLSQSS